MGQATTDLCFDLARHEAQMEQRHRHHAWVSRRTGWRSLVWRTEDGRELRIDQMTPSHALNAVTFCTRNAERIAARVARRRHALWEIMTVPMDYDDPDDPMWTWPEPNLHPVGDEALAILRRQPLYKALVLRATLALR